MNIATESEEHTPYRRIKPCKTDQRLTTLEWLGEKAFQGAVIRRTSNRTPVAQKAAPKTGKWDHMLQNRREKKIFVS